MTLPARLTSKYIKLNLGYEDIEYTEAREFNIVRKSLPEIRDHDILVCRLNKTNYNFISNHLYRLK